MSITQKNIPHYVNGENVIMFTDKKTVTSMQNGFDVPSIASWYREDPNNNHKGMMSLWGQQSPINYRNSNILQDLIMKNDVLEVNGWDGGFTYDLPINDYKGCYTTRDTSDQAYPGIEGNSFKLVLNKAYTTGDRLKADKMYGQEVIVSGEEPVVAVAEGFEHTVTLTDNDKSTFYAKKYLVKGVKYKKIGHAILGERGTNFSHIDMPDTIGTMKCEFRLGAFSGVEAYMTGKADSRSFRGGDAQSKQYLDMMSQEMGAENQYAVLAPLKRGADGQRRPDFKNMKLGATLEFLTMRELEKLTHNRLMWGNAGTISDSNGVTKLNEGLWNQLRRGKVMQYARPGGITRAHIKEMIEYVFRINPNKPVVERRIKLKAGRYAYENILEIFKDEVNQQIANLAPFLGADALIKGVVTGNDLMNLQVKPVRFTNVFISGIGMVDIEEDTSLNYTDDDRMFNGIHPEGMASTAYAVIVWDADSQEYSNNKELPKGAKLIEGGRMGANIHLVKPEGEHLFFGSTNGRYDYKRSSDIMTGGIKQIGQEFWCFQIADIHVSDASRFVMLELDPAARKGYN